MTTRKQTACFWIRWVMIPIWELHKEVLFTVTRHWLNYPFRWSQLNWGRTIKRWEKNSNSQNLRPITRSESQHATAYAQAKGQYSKKCERSRSGPRGCRERRIFLCKRNEFSVHRIAKTILRRILKAEINSFRIRSQNSIYSPIQEVPACFQQAKSFWACHKHWHHHETSRRRCFFAAKQSFHDFLVDKTTNYCSHFWDLQYERQLFRNLLRSPVWIWWFLFFVKSIESAGYPGFEQV